MEDVLGELHPRMEIRFERLSVSADIIVKDETQLKAELPTLSNVIKTEVMRMTASKRVVTKQILRSMSGVLRPGTMTLVLGQPGSGKSALMKILSGRFPVKSNITVEGQVTYNDSPQLELRAKLPQFVSYVDQRDRHYPTLTVKETLQFAYECSGEELSKRDMAGILDTSRAIQQLGLENCQNTVLGDTMLRGVSGGERKRVTTGEMTFGSKPVLMMDEISTGLDSAATFDIVSSQQKLAKSFGKTVVISLLQPSPEVFELFDDVLLLNDGYVLYHGPRSQVMNYFEGLGFKRPPSRDVADFLMDLGTVKQHQYEVEVAPRKPSEFAGHFERSFIYAHMLDTLRAPLNSSLLEGSKEYIATIPEFNQGFWSNTSTLIKRQLKVFSRDRTLISSRVFMSFLLGLLNASSFFQFDEVDAQLVMGIAYVVVGFVMIGQSAQVPAFVAIRDVFKKQRRANFFRTSAFVLATSTSQIPLAVIETLIFGSIMYWMCGFVSTVQGFVVFELVLFLSSMVFGAWFFFLAVVCPDLNVANAIAMLSDLLFTIYSGFAITKGEIPSYLLWIYWISPLTWGIRAVAVNQYTNSSFDVCIYRDVDYCEKYDMTMGAYSLSSFDVQTERYWLWLGIFVLIAIYVVFMIMTWIVLEYYCYENAPNATLEAENKVTVDNLVQAKQGYNLIETPRSADVRVEVDESAKRPQLIPVTLAFKDLWYSVPGPENAKASINLLKGISGFALPGTITALMGSSGAGKTTLMDVIAGRKTGGTIRGEVLLNGYPATELAIRRATGYCEQVDIHSDASTFREALTFSAFLRQDAAVSDIEKYNTVNECLDLLDLHSIADQIIRNSSAEQMKRLTIGVELAAQPSVLFLDEPTSGLDARSAKLIMDGVRKVADTGRTVICTIHQPSAEVFCVFDRLLLLKRGGETVFFGDLGENASTLIDYFETIDGVPKLAKDYNPATWMLEVIGAGVGKCDDKFDFVSCFKNSEHFYLLQDYFSVSKSSLQPLTFTRKRAASNVTQAKFLLNRFFDLYWQTPSYNLTRFIVSIIIGVAFGITFIDAEYSSYQGINSGLGTAYMTTSFITYITFNAVLPITYRERASYYRERSSEMYNAFWYFMGSTIVEIPYCFGASFIFLVIYFPLVRFSGVVEFFSYWLNLSMLVLVQAYFGQLLAYSLPSIEVASVFTVLIGSICTLFTGFNPPASSIPQGYQWLHHFVPHKRTFASLSAIVFSDCAKIGCQEISNAPPSLAAGTTVREYLDGVFEVKHSDIWCNFAVVVVWAVGLRLLALVALRYINYHKR
ncbi:ABC transporter G family member 31 [Phytophthora nicotianae]|uniref:ABC transporter G family member 31 n=1 Tax=Phytophthora nicotianae TaxID=4792 RepID=A0A0W8CKH8_PHYNI|nr:ABC transporter G family member 31 [Phytophthora nicotianae]